MEKKQLATPKLTKVLDSANFWGWVVQDSVVNSPFWQIGKLGGGKNSVSPCIRTKIILRMLDWVRNYGNESGGLH